MATHAKTAVSPQLQQVRELAKKAAADVHQLKADDRDYEAFRIAFFESFNREYARMHAPVSNAHRNLVRELQRITKL